MKFSVAGIVFFLFFNTVAHGGACAADEIRALLADPDLYAAAATIETAACGNSRERALATARRRATAELSHTISTHVHTRYTERSTAGAGSSTEYIIENESDLQLDGISLHEYINAPARGQVTVVASLPIARYRAGCTAVLHGAQSAFAEGAAAEKQGAVTTSLRSYRRAIEELNACRSQVSGSEVEWKELLSRARSRCNGLIAALHFDEPSRPAVYVKDGHLLSVPRVRLTADGGNGRFPVAGMPLTFSFITGSGSLSAATGITDKNGSCIVPIAVLHTEPIVYQSHVVEVRCDPALIDGAQQPSARVTCIPAARVIVAARVYEDNTDSTYSFIDRTFVRACAAHGYSVEENNAAERSHRREYSRSVGADAFVDARIVLDIEEDEYGMYRATARIMTSLYQCAASKTVPAVKRPGKVTLREASPSSARTAVLERISAQLKTDILDLLPSPGKAAGVP
jgi:hypothetical protein